MPLVFAAVFLNPTGLSTDIIKMYWEEKKKEVFGSFGRGKGASVNYDKLCRHASCAWSSHIESAPLLSTAS